MFTKWTEHLSTDTDKELFKSQVESAKPVLDRVKEILILEDQALERAELNPKMFDTPNWDYLQAFQNGYRAALSVATKLVDLDQQRTYINK